MFFLQHEKLRKNQVWSSEAKFCKIPLIYSSQKANFDVKRCKTLMFLYVRRETLPVNALVFFK